jgi:hypothetical protein
MDAGKDMAGDLDDVLAYEHDGMAEQAAMAHERLNRCVQRLRDVYDPHAGFR